MQNFSVSRGHLSGLNKWLPNTGRFTFWGDLTKAAVTIVYIDRFNWNLTLWLLIDDALLMQNFARMRYCLLKLRKCTRVYLCKTIMVMKILCYRYSTINNFEIIFFNEIRQPLNNLLGIKCTKLFKFVQIWHFYCMISRGSVFYQKHCIHRVQKKDYRYTFSWIASTNVNLLL